MIMGLRKCLTAADPFAFRAWDGSTPATYNEYLVTAPRHYVEQLYPGSRGPGALWTSRHPNKWGDTAINFFASLEFYRWPSWAIGWWIHDGRFGRAIERLDASSFAGVTADYFTAEPDGTVWAYGTHSTAYYGGPVIAIRPGSSVYSLETDTPLDVAGFEGPGNDTRAFAIDRTLDRVFVSWTGDNTGCVRAYKWSAAPPRPILFTIYAPNPVEQIILTHDGFVYLVDALDWLTAYDSSGAFAGAMRNPRNGTPPNGRAYGWDRYYRRILYVEGTAPDAEGASTLRCEGFYPVADPTILAAPIPRRVPRRGRTIPIVSRVAGCGAEPLAGRPATFAGVGVASDSDGDLVTLATPATTDPLTVEVTTP